MEDGKQSNIDSDILTEESAVQQITNFGHKLGEDTGGEFTVYIYRLVKDPETQQRKKPFVKKLIGVEPDPGDIAEQFRGGKYLIQFVWYEIEKNKRVQRSRGFILDVDPDVFPPLPHQNAPGQNALMPYQPQPGVSESMQLQLATMSTVAEIVKAAYTQGNNGKNQPVQTDPLEMFGNVIDTMESSMQRVIEIQSTVMERVFQKNMETKFGLTDKTDGAADPAAAGDNETFVGKYAPIIGEVVSGIREIMKIFGSDIPPEVVKKVQEDNRFKELLKDRRALVVIGTALRNEYGFNEASRIMRTFGVQMVPRQGPSRQYMNGRPPVTKTPDIGEGGGPRRRSAEVPAAEDGQYTETGRQTAGNRPQEVPPGRGTPPAAGAGSGLKRPRAAATRQATKYRNGKKIKTSSKGKGGR